MKFGALFALLLIASLAACAGTPDKTEASNGGKEGVYVTGSRIPQERAKSDSSMTVTDPNAAGQLYQRNTSATSMGK